MDMLISAMNDIMPYLLIGMSIIIILLFIMVVVLFKAVGKVESRYRKLMKGTTNNNLEEMLLERLDSIEDAKERSDKALEECKRLEVKMKDCVQKVAIMRYKAFENVGSDLSFSIAMLDDRNDGVILNWYIWKARKVQLMQNQLIREYQDMTFPRKSYMF